MKKQIIIASLAGMCLLTSCGNSKQFSADTAYKNEAVAESYEENYDYEAPEATEKRSDSGLEAEAAEYRQSEVRAINTQMLVYACDMSIDVLEFDESVDKLHALIDKYNGFLESENYSDGANTGKWQYSDEQKWKTLSTVIRIPSASYANFCKDAEAVGDMRRKNASVQNLTAEYSDLKTTLAIYEAKEKRYITLLSEMKSESEAISVEKELTNIQIEIARIKTRMTTIENDVIYQSHAHRGTGILRGAGHRGNGYLRTETAQYDFRNMEKVPCKHGRTAVPPHQTAAVSLPARNRPVHSQSDQKIHKEKEKRRPCSESKVRASERRAGKNEYRGSGRGRSHGRYGTEIRQPVILMQSAE